MKDENANETMQYEDSFWMTEEIEKIQDYVSKLPKRKYTEEELEEARQNLTLMNDRVFFGTFENNKNRHLITEIVNALRKIHLLDNIPNLKTLKLQKMSLIDVFGRGMIGDLFGMGKRINIAMEIQKASHAGYAIRGTITASEAMRDQFGKGTKFTKAPDVIGINILGFGLPELRKRKMFCSRIVRCEYESKETFLSDKYSEYYIELPKMKNYAKESLPDEYHDIWDICSIFEAKVKDYEEVIRMQKVKNKAALALSDEVKQTVASNKRVKKTLNRKEEFNELLMYLLDEAKEKAIEMAEKKAVEMAEKKAVEIAEKKVEDLLITVLQSNAPIDTVEAVRVRAGITEARLAELKEQALVSQSS